MLFRSLEPETGTFRICRFSPEDPTTLGHNSIRSILKDNQGGMWIGTFYGGLNYYHPLAPSFGRLQHSAWRNSLSDNTVSCIAEDPDNGNLWIGTNDGGLNYYNRKTGVFSYSEDLVAEAKEAGLAAFAREFDS